MWPSHCRGLLSFCFLLALVPAILPAPAAAQSYHIKTYHSQDGAPSNIVYNAAQDALGNIWFASRVGLSVFDGISWQEVSSDNPNAPAGAGFVSIDERGNVWWASIHNPFRVCRLTDGQWEQLPNMELQVNNWDTIGICSYINADGISTAVVASRNGYLRMWTGQGWISLPTEESGMRMYSIELDQSHLLISTEKGLLTLDLEKPHVLLPPPAGLPEGPVYATASNLAIGKSWLIGKHWIALIEDQKLSQVFDVPKSETPIFKSLFSACQGPNGGLYYADFAQVFYFHPKLGFENFTLNTGLATDDGNWVMMDRESNIWVTSHRGISKISSRRLSCYDRNHDLLEDEVTSIIQRASGDIVLGHRTGLTFFGTKIQTKTFEAPPGLVTRVMDLAEDDKGRIWVAAYHKGLGLLHDDGSIKWFGEGDGLSLPVYSVLQHPDFGLLVGSANGIFRQVGSVFESMSIPDTPEDGNLFIRRLVPLASGGIAIATGYKGIILWKSGEFTHIPGDRQEGTNSTFAVFEQNDGQILVGTAVGLRIVQNGQLQIPQSPVPTIDKPIYSITRDNADNLWFGSDEGVMIWDGTSLIKLTTQEGLLGNECNRDALLCNKDGNIWIGTDGGLSIFKKELDTVIDIAPVLHLTHIFINGEEVPIDQPIRTNGPIGSLVIEVRAPSFASNHPIKFRIMTTECSDIKIPVTVLWPGLITLTNVPSGIFQIRVQAKTHEGLTTNSITLPMITIVPPLAQRWYSKVVLAVASIFILWLCFAFFTGRQYAKNLEEEVQLQTLDLRNSEEKTRLESERLAGTLESISEGVVVVDGKGSIILMNPAAENMFERTHLPDKDCSMAEILPVESLVDSNQAALYQQWLNNPTGVRFLNKHVPTLGNNQLNCWLEISAVPISGSDQGIVIAFRNITDQRLAEQEERRSQKLESLGLMAGGIAHDFNNLLAIMLGNLSLAENTLTTTPTEAEHLTNIRHATERAQKLTQQLLTFARGGGPQRQPSDVAAILKDSASFSLSGSNVTCEIDTPNDLWWAEVDTSQISQVFGNILINAFQAMPDGGRIIISARNLLDQPGFPSDSKCIGIQIQDFGPGISDYALGQIFDPYFTTKDTGSGLGLAIAHSVIKKHDGILSVKSKLGQGTTFSMILPACEPQRIMQPGALPKPTASEALHVLFMDDEESIRNIMERMLQFLGHQSKGVPDGEAALEAFQLAQNKGKPFDLIILDLTIPGRMGGKTTIEHLHGLGVNVPIIVASGYSNSQILANFEDFGIAGILNKPFTTTDLKKVMDESL